MFARGEMPSSSLKLSSRWSRPNVNILRYVVAAVLVIALVGWVKFTPRSAAVPIPSTSNLPTGSFASSRPIARGKHPIDTLIKEAEKEFKTLLSKETRDVSAAAARYRDRRGRHPPPGFEVWFQFARQHKGIMVEEFFDQIYHDLNPFWGVEPRQIRMESKNFEMTINIRNGSASARSDWNWTQIWLDLIKTIEGYLPDMDLALNAMDEPRLVVPWEKINEYMEAEKKSRRLIPVSEALAEYSGRADVDAEPPANLNSEWDRSSRYFDIAKRGCPPSSATRLAETMKDFSRDPKISLRYAAAHLYGGYVSNWTLATSICHQPDLQGLHGAFIEPLTIASSDHLMPMFGGSKLATNNEILLPPPMYWSRDERYSGTGFNKHPWEKKRDTLIWRGGATGGRNKVDNWTGFQRHRFVSMVNGTQVKRAEDWIEIPRNFELPSPLYNLRAAQDGHLGDWVVTFGDAAFMDLMCWEPKVPGQCHYTGDYYSIARTISMAQQFQSKYLPDIDGNSFSGRYRGFLRSSSLPIKATIFKEWHDSRLVPWKHFVPMDNRFEDIYGIMEYFLGYSGSGTSNAVRGHDDAARRIAWAGQEWAEKVLRPEDMQIYVLRVLLEFARVSDDRRDRLAYVADLER